MKRIKVAILGSGNIGTDLLIKVLRSPYLSCQAFLGRNLDSPGMLTAAGLGVPISNLGIRYLENNPECCDVVFDASSAIAHLEHAQICERLGKLVIDLTPAKIGTMCVPYIGSSYLHRRNINMVTCSGQASIPLAYALAATHNEIEYVEVISSIASLSAGPATRLNMDEHIHTTEEALKAFSGAKEAKAILNLNPALPSIHMQTTILATVRQPNLEALRLKVDEIICMVQAYVPGYELLVAPMIENERIAMMVKVKGLGDYLPEYAGNLDIMNCAALAIAEGYAKHTQAGALPAKAGMTPANKME